MEDYTNLKTLATQKRILLNYTSDEVIAHEEHIGKTKDVFVKLFLGEETNDNIDPSSQEDSDPIVPDPILDPSIAWADGIQGIYPAPIAPVTDPEGYVRFADQSNQYVVFLKQESTAAVSHTNVPDVILPSVSLINAMNSYGIKRTAVGSTFSDGTPASSDLWPAETLVYHWTKECLAAVRAGTSFVNTVWALEWSKETGLTSRITTDSRALSGMPYFSLYTGV